MLGPKYLQGCMVAFILLTMLSLGLEGTFFGDYENNLINELTKWTLGTFSWFAIPLVFASLLYHLPDLLSWDYSFFTSLGAAGAIIRLLLGAFVSFGVVWGFMTLLLPVGVQVMGQLGGGLLGIFRRF